MALVMERYEGTCESLESHSLSLLVRDSQPQAGQTHRLRVDTSPILLDRAFMTPLYRFPANRGCLLLILYVDDMNITGDEQEGIHSLKTFLNSQFDVKDLGLLWYFLGIEVVYSPKGYLLSQMKHLANKEKKEYLADILQQAGLTNSKIVNTPLELNHKLSASAGTPLSDPSRYQQVVWSLVNLTITRSDIAYQVQVVSQFVSTPTTLHWAIVLHVLRYLQGTMI